MDNDQNQDEKAIRDLSQKTIALRKKIKLYPRLLSTRKTYIEMLLKIETLLAHHPIDSDRLRHLKIGIGRTLTDGDENTPIGQELSLFHRELHNFLKMHET